MLDAVVQGVQFLRGGGVHPITQDRGQAAIGFHNGSSAISVRNHPTTFRPLQDRPGRPAVARIRPPSGLQEAQEAPSGGRGVRSPQHPEKPSTAVLAARAAGCPQTGVWGREVVRPPAFWFALPDDFSTSRVISYARIGRGFTSRRAGLTSPITR